MVAGLRMNDEKGVKAGVWEGARGWSQGRAVRMRDCDWVGVIPRNDVTVTELFDWIRHEILYMWGGLGLTLRLECEF